MFDFQGLSQFYYRRNFINKIHDSILMNQPKPKKNSVEFPRKKKHLSSLNTLLDTKLIKEPEQIVKQRLFPSRKISSSQSVASIKHVKSQDSIKRKQLDEFRSTVLSKMAQNFNSTKRQQVQYKTNYSQFGKTKSLFIKHNNPKQNIVYTKHNRQSTAFVSSNHNQMPSILHKQNQREMQSQPCQQRSHQRHQFLRKGSSINRQIVINLLKLKLLREKDNLQKQQFSNDQIIKMIKLYKGNNDAAIQLDYESILKRKSVGHHSHIGKEICGWDNDLNEEFYTDHQ